MTQTDAIDAIRAERVRQQGLALGGNTRSHDTTNSRNDWIAIILSYLGRASQRVFRNEQEQCDYRQNLIKAAALIVAALEADE